MPATRTISSLAATITQDSLVTALLAAFNNAGYSAPVLNITSGTDRIIAYQITVGSGTFGSFFLRLRITSALVIFQQLSSGIPSGGTSGANASGEINYGTLSTTLPITFNGLNSGTNNEFKLVMLTQGTTFFPLGYISPANRRGSWSLNSWTWGFIFTSSATNVLRGTALNQYNNSDYDILAAGNTRMGTANPIDNERDLLTNFVILSQANQGSPGSSTNDLAVVCASGSSRYDTSPLTGTSGQYLIVNPGSGGFAVRLA